MNTLNIFIVQSLDITHSCSGIKSHACFVLLRYSKTNVSLEGPAYQTGMENQRNLFWWGSPHLVISMIQFMNFGYALSLAIVIMYWPYLTGPIEPYWYAVSIFICYGVFIYILGLVLPQYTLCTSLGYLTNKKELQETVAMHRLDEMGTQQRRRIIQIANQRKESMIVHGMTTVQDPILSKGPNSDCQKETAASSADRLERRKTLLLADMVKAGTDTLRTQLPDASRENLLAREQRVQDRRYNRRKSLSEGVSVMRGMAPFGIVTPAHIGAEMSVQEIDKKTPLARSRFTHKRIEPFSQLAGWQDIASQEDDDNYNQIPTGRKSSSRSGVIKGWQEIIPHDDDDDEVAAMRRCKDDSDAVRLLERDRQNKHNWADERLRAWKDSGGDPVTAESGSGQQDQKSGIITMAQPKEEFRDENNGPVRLTRIRHARKKSVSASAIIQSWQDFSVIDQQGGLTDNPKSIDDQRCISHHLAGLSSSHDLDDYQITRSGKTIHVPAARGDRYDYPPIHSRNEVGIDFHKMRQAREYESDDTLKMKGITNVIDSVTIEGIDSFYIVSEKRSDKECDDDNDTVQTEKSTGELSDVDVVQTMRGIFPILHTEIVPWHTRLLGLLTPMALIHGVTSYIKGPAYRPMSHIFGTMVIFFFIGFRVEAMIAKTGVFFDPDSAWGSSLIFGFWSEASWLACFMILDVAILTLLPFAKCDSLGDHCLNVAAIMDILLSGMTMTLLFVAESRRCCYDEPDITPGKRELVLDYDFENECTCPIWGRRTYNGFGVIEPFTSLIALRLFRFQFAKVLVKHMDKRRNKDKEEADESTDADKDASIPPSHDAHHGRCGDVRNMHDTRTLLEHWERAITEFPDIVERYGQFSGELLRAMLGLHVEEVSSDVSTSLQSESNDSENANEKRKRVDAEKPDTWQSHIRLAGTRYRHLSAEAQGLIIAGSLGKPVKVMPNDDLNDRAAEMPTVNEDCENVDHNNKAMLELAEFEVDLHKISIERKAHYSFVAPFASLVRSMRRCDRKLVPFLTTWVAVDVVVTQFEIVYFEAVDDNSSDEAHLWHHTESCRSALQATKGGKGLRLCDVALGRKVVGHLDLTHVTEVHVEQDADVLSDTATLEKVALLFADKQDMASEYWYDSQTLQAGKHEYCRAVRWLTMHEERLKLTTDAGTLYLRYYADLACAEAERNNHLCHDIRVLKKEVAFQWAESIVRIVGPEQLFKQKLPHFGEGNDEELYDYLETNHFHEKELESAQKEMGDVFSDRQGIGDRVSDISRKMSLRFRRSQSFGEPSNFFSRSASFGAATIEQETPKRQSTMTLRRLLSLGLSERRELPTQQEINSHLNADAEPENPPKEICDDIQLKWLAMSSPSTNPVTATDADANPTASPKRNVSWGLQSSGSEIFSMRTSSSLLVNPLRTGSSSGTANEGTYGDTSAKENGID
jgi:hypothetical protein